MAVRANAEEVEAVVGDGNAGFPCHLFALGSQDLASATAIGSEPVFWKMIVNKWQRSGMGVNRRQLLAGGRN